MEFEGSDLPVFRPDRSLYPDHPPRGFLVFLLIALLVALLLGSSRRALATCHSEACAIRLEQQEATRGHSSLPSWHAGSAP